MKDKKILDTIAKLYNENSYGETVYIILSDLLFTLGYSKGKDYIVVKSDRKNHWEMKVL